MNLDIIHSLLPQLILVFGATTVLMCGAWYTQRQFWLNAGVVICLAAAYCAAFVDVPLVDVAGMYSTAPYARFFTALWSLMMALSLLLTKRYADIHEFGGGEFTSLLLFATMGMSLLSAATSFLGLLLGLEAFTLVLYVLIAFNRTDDDGAEAGLKYLVFGAVATAFLTFGMALIYSVTGTFQLQEAMTGLIVDGQLRPIGLAGWALMLVAIGFKISLAPFHLWTPDVYQGAPAPVSGILATSAKGAVLAALFPLVGLLGEGGTEIKSVLVVLALISMLLGTFAALPQSNLKRMLAYSSIVHMGYLVIAILVGGVDGGRALLFYLVAYGFATLGAFGVVTSLATSETELQEYESLRGLGYRHPRRCIVLAVLLLSLAGIPPLAGFFAKFALFQAALGHGYGVLAVVGIITSLLSVYYYLRPIVVLFMQGDECAYLRLGAKSEYCLLGLCLVAVIVLGLMPGPLLDLVTAVLPY